MIVDAWRSGVSVDAWRSGVSAVLTLGGSLLSLAVLLSSVAVINYK